MSARSNLLYLDCSVYGGAFDIEFAERTLPLFELIRSERYRIVYSALVEAEVMSAPAHVVALFEEMRPAAELVELSPQARTLQTAYLAHGIVRARDTADALHVAIATGADCRAIVSWNFKHIVHMDKIRLYNAVNRLLGYNDLAIHSPDAVVGNGRKPQPG